MRRNQLTKKISVVSGREAADNSLETLPLLMGISDLIKFIFVHIGGIL
ncbi:hypothetical protein QFZ72_001013 [Bacillus sp. V2I10]|nr:hypothetical protein [Bacillus sp. V2I10]